MRRAIVVALLVGLAACAKEDAGPKTPVTETPVPGTGCGPVIHFPIQGREHISPPERVKYSTQPPTSGNHYFIPGVAPAATGTHTTQVVDEAQVHNLEHGHMLIQYKAGALPGAVVDGLAAVTRKHAKYILTAPRTAPFDGDAPLAFTVWGVGQWCSSPNDATVTAAEAFYKRFVRHAPEDIAGNPIFELPPP